jgi:hypothetical protein
MSNTRTGVFEDLIEMTASELRPVMNRLRNVVLKIDPDACEVVRMGDRAATYGVGPKKNTEGYVYLMPHRSWINLGLFHGASLEDPGSLLQGSGVKMGHEKIKTVVEAEAAVVRALIVAAINERRTALSQH